MLEKLVLELVHTSWRASRIAERVVPENLGVMRGGVRDAPILVPYGSSLHVSSFSEYVQYPEPHINFIPLIYIPHIMVTYYCRTLARNPFTQKNRHARRTINMRLSTLKDSVDVLT